MFFLCSIYRTGFSYSLGEGDQLDVTIISRIKIQCIVSFAWKIINARLHGKYTLGIIHLKGVRKKLAMEESRYLAVEDQIILWYIITAVFWNIFGDCEGVSIE